MHWTWLSTLGVFFSVLLLPLPVNAIEAKEKIPLLLQESVDAEGKILPINTGLEKLLFYFERETGLKFERRMLPWNRAKAAALEGQGIIWGFSQSPERLSQYTFSDPILRANIWAIAYHMPKFKLGNIEDLRGKTVSVERGVSHGLRFEEVRDILFKVDEDPASAPLRFKKLIAKRSDVLLWGLVQFDQPDKIERYLNDTYIPTLNDPALLGKTFYVSSKPLFQDTIHFAGAKGKFEAELNLINKATKRGLKSGELVKLLEELR